MNIFLKTALCISLSIICFSVSAMQQAADSSKQKSSPTGVQFEKNSPEALAIAITVGEMADIKAAVEAGAPVNGEPGPGDPLRTAPLRIAALFSPKGDKRTEIMDYLVSKNASLDAVKDLLPKAAQFSDLSLVIWLVKHGITQGNAEALAHVNKNLAGLNPESRWAGIFRAIAEVLQRQFPQEDALAAEEAQATRMVNLELALYNAIMADNMAGIRAAVEAGASVQAIRYPQGGNKKIAPLAVAAFRTGPNVQRLLIMNYLRGRGASLNGLGSDGLGQAITNRDLALVTWLMQNGFRERTEAHVELAEALLYVRLLREHCAPESNDYAIFTEIIKDITAT